VVTGTYDVFLSYRPSDRLAAERIAIHLRDHSFKVWFDLWDLTPGKLWSEELEAGLNDSRAVIVVVGANGLGTWQSAMCEVLLTQAAQNYYRMLIPMIAPGASIANMPYFLQQYKAWDLGEDEQTVLERVVYMLRRSQQSLLSSKRPPKVFLCHAKEDCHRIENLYFDLRDNGLDPWYDKENLVIGDSWEDEIVRSIEGSDFFGIFISDISRKKRGFIQKEIRTAVSEYQRRPEGAAYLLPVRLENCEVPSLKLDDNRTLANLHWVAVVSG
jgi:hypothetical protein